MRPCALKVRGQLGNFAVGQDSGFTVPHVRLVDPLLNRLHRRHNPSLTGLWTFLRLNGDQKQASW